MRGRSLSWVMPVTSALNICIPPEVLSIGTTASVKRMIPRPPIHCVMHLQTSIDLGTLSSDGSTDAPVVVKPLIVSKKASVTDMWVP